jgi:hypothetical protein
MQPLLHLHGVSQIADRRCANFSYYLTSQAWSRAMKLKGWVGKWSCSIFIIRVPEFGRDLGKPRTTSDCSGQDSKRVLSEYNSEALPEEQTCLVHCMRIVNGRIKLWRFTARCGNYTYLLLQHSNYVLCPRSEYISYDSHYKQHR